MVIDNALAALLLPGCSLPALAEVMKAFVAGLSDEDMDDLAACYGGLKP